jgi:hypothetical protein
MSDIDFDELDREVKKLVNTNEPQDAAENISVTSSQAEHNEILDDTHSFAEADINDNTEEKHEDADTSMMSDQKSAKPRGRFMDVVHPSSDMAGDQGLGARLTSQGERKSLTPMHTEQVQAAQDDTNDNNGSVREVQSTDMPDPIDVHESQSSANVEKMPDSSDKESEAKELDMPSSAFLADAQVEKRPLGQHSDSPDKDEDTSEKETPATQTDEPAGNEVDNIAQKAIDEANGKTDDAADASSIDTNVPLPPELEKDLVAIEAGESPDEILSGTVESDEEKQDNQTETTDAAQKEDGDAAADKKTDTTTSLLSSGSIPQQYKIAMQQKANGETGKQLFDAEHYTTTPAKAAKKGASTFATIMQWFFIVVGVLLLGAVIGAGLYTFVSNQ